MKPLVILKEAFKKDGWGAAALLSAFLVGSWSLISAEWATATLFLSLSAFFGVALREKLRPVTEASAKWSAIVTLAAGIGFLAVAYANAVAGEIVLAVIMALAGAMTLIGVFSRQRRQAARRPV